MSYVVKLSNSVRDEASLAKIAALIQHQVQMLDGVNCIDMFDPFVREKFMTRTDQPVYMTRYLGQAMDTIQRALNELDVEMYANPIVFGRPL